MEYTIIIVSTKAVKAVQEHICGLNNRECAERHAEGIARGLRLAGKKYGVIMCARRRGLKGIITKDCFPKHMGVFYKWFWQNGKL